MEGKLSLVSCTTEDVLWLYMPPAAVLKTPATSALVARHTNSDGHRRHLRLTAAIVAGSGDRAARLPHQEPNAARSGW